MFTDVNIRLPFLITLKIKVDIDYMYLTLLEALHRGEVSLAILLQI